MYRVVFTQRALKDWENLDREIQIESRTQEKYLQMMKA